MIFVSTSFYAHTTKDKNNQLILHDGRSITIIKNSCLFSNMHLIFWLWISRVLSRPMVSKLFQAKDLNVTYSYRNKIIANINRMTFSRFSKILMMLRTDEYHCTKLIDITVTVSLSGHTQALYLSLASSLMFLHHGSCPLLSSIFSPSLYEQIENWSYQLPSFSNTRLFADTHIFVYVFSLCNTFLHSQPCPLPIQRQSTLLYVEHMAPLLILL